MPLNALAKLLLAAKHRISYTNPTFIAGGVAQNGVSSGALTLNTTGASLLVAAQNCNQSGTVGNFWDDVGLAHLSITALTAIVTNVSATYTMNSYAGFAMLVGRAIWVTGMANGSNNSSSYAGVVLASTLTSVTISIANTGGMTTVGGQTATGVVGNAWSTTTQVNGGGCIQKIIWSNLPLTTSSHVFNASPNAFEGSCPVYAFAGGSTTGWKIDDNNGGAITGVSNAFTTSTLTLHNTEQQVICAFIGNNNFAPTSIVSMSNGYTGAVNNGHSFANEAGGAAYLLAQVASTGTTFTFNNGGSSAACQAIVAFVKV